MMETKDPAIKLFGKTIPLPVDGDDTAVSSDTGDSREDMNCDHERTTTSEEEEKKEISVEGEEEEEEPEKELLAVESNEAKQEEDEEGSENPETLLKTNDNPKTPSIDEETVMPIKSSKSGKEQNDAENSQEKPLKKPDKILPCPRCNSMDTKFCYYNNYNVNQPRHFCKSCQRYWTAGGTMRNVPVGAGRRKNKNSPSQFRHITISEALQAARIDAPNGAHNAALKTNGTVLNFGSDTSLSESMASVLNLAEKTLWNGTRNGFHKMEEQNTPIPCRVGGGESGSDDHSCGSSSVTALNSMDEGGRNCAPVVQEPLMPKFQAFPSQIPCLPSVPWPYNPWNSAVPPPAFCHPGFPISFYPAANYWNCTIPAGTWNVPWLSPNSTPNSSTLGKHSRDESNLKTENREEEQPTKQKSTTSERCIWVPKTLRIDDPDEAAKSSIWATLGIKNDSITRGGLLKGFQPKGTEKINNHGAETSPVLLANPAALSRSLNFHESS